MIILPKCLITNPNDFFWKLFQAYNICVWFNCFVVLFIFFGFFYFACFLWHLYGSFYELFFFFLLLYLLRKPKLFFDIFFCVTFHFFFYSSDDFTRFYGLSFCYCWRLIFISIKLLTVNENNIFFRSRSLCRCRSFWSF